MSDHINWLSRFLDESTNHLLTFPSYSLTDKMDSDTLQSLESHGLSIHYANHFSAELFDFSSELPIDDAIAVCYVSGRMSRQITPLLKTLIHNMLYKISGKNTHLIIVLENIIGIEFPNFYLLSELVKSGQVASITILDNQDDLKTHMGVEFVHSYARCNCVDYVPNIPVSDLIIFEDVTVTA